MTQFVGGMTGIKTHWITRLADARGLRKLACGNRGHYADGTTDRQLVTCERCVVWLLAREPGQPKPPARGEEE